MRQIVLIEPGKFEAQSAPPPAPAEKHALVRVRTIGICGTDLHAFAGRQPFFDYPRILGHELAVEVISAPDNEHGLRAGDRCAVEPYLACGACYACSLGRSNCCEQLQTLGVHCDGGMRGMLRVPVNLLHKSDTLSLDQLALVETLGIGAHAVERAAVQPGERVLVVGAGPIGLAVTQFALAAGAQVRVLDVSEFRRQFAERFGVPTMPAFDGQLTEVVFDATGSAASMEASFDFVSHAGRLVMVGISQQRLSFDNRPFHRRELTIMSSRNSWGLFPKIMAMIDRGQIDTQPWITHRMPMVELPQQFATIARQPDLVKAVVDVGPDDWAE